MNDLKNIRVYSDVHGILSIDGMSMGETSEPLCFMLPGRRALVSFSPLCRAKTGFYLGFSRAVDFEGIPKVTEDDGTLCITAVGDTVIADVCPPFLPEQPRPPHILASAASGRYKAIIYWDRWITFAIENERGEIVYARPLAAERGVPEAGRARVLFRNAADTMAFGAYETGGRAYAACAAVSGRELLFAECSEYSFGDKLILKHSGADESGSVYTEIYGCCESGLVKEGVSCERYGGIATPASAVHTLAEAVMHGCEEGAMSLLAAGLRSQLDMRRLAEFFGDVRGVERRTCGEDAVILKYCAGNHVFNGRYVKAELTGGLISNITMD